MVRPVALRIKALWLRESPRLESKFNPYDSCPCLSGKKARLCCLNASRDFVKKPKNILPPGPVTGYAHPCCYAASTEDCSKDISGEHIISATVIKYGGLGTTIMANPPINVRGFPWLKNGEERKICANTFKSGVLCRRHNNALSPLDEEAGRLVRALSAFFWHLADKREGEEGQLFCGEDIERWLLKTLCALVASGNAGMDGIVLPREVPRAWVDLLFGDGEFRSPNGLYLLPFEMKPYRPKIGFQTVIDRSGSCIYGLDCNLNGLKLGLTLDGVVTQAVYHARSFEVRDDITRRFILFSWTGNSGANIAVKFSEHAPFDPSW